MQYPMRHPTEFAIQSLAKRFNLPNTPTMQDWEYEVADSNRISEFLQAYVEEQFNEDEKFVLMEILIQSFADSDRDLTQDIDWQCLLNLLEKNIALHATTICYWSFGNIAYDLCWAVTPYLRRIKLRNHLKISS